MVFTRREITKFGLVGLAGFGSLPLAYAEAGSSASGLKVLILGGTGFLGPHIVESAMARGHTITLFNRGKTDPHLFPTLEKLKGNRGGDLAPLRDRQWDVVIDTSSFMPAQVAKSASLLKPNVGQYIFISSTAVYKPLLKPNMDEDSQVYVPGSAESSEYSPFESYGAAKYGSELEVLRYFPQGGTNIRSDTIVGPGDYKHFRYPYWIRRATQDGEILGPGNPGDFVQYIDVRDLADWIVHCAEHNVTGTYTASSPPGTYTMGKMIEDCQTVAGKDLPVVWVGSDFLAEREGPLDIPFWVPDRAEQPGAGQLSTTRAQNNGLKQRPKLQTAQDVFHWFNQLSKEEQNIPVGITRDQEAELIAGWREALKQAAA